MNSDYIELRARSAFSFLEGATTPEDLAARAAELGYSAMALGDRDGLYGAPRFYLAAKCRGHPANRRRGTDARRRLAPLRPRTGSQALPKSLPHDHRLEDARAQSRRARTRRLCRCARLSRQGREPHHARRTRTLRPRTDLPWRRRDEPAVAHAGSRRRSRRAEPAARRDFRREQFLHRFAAASRRRRGAP